MLKNKLRMIRPLKMAIESDTEYKVDRIKELAGGSMNYIFKVAHSSMFCGGVGRRPKIIPPQNMG